eukprot:jgi/Hompol1/5862/HPOL_001116-RA
MRKCMHSHKPGLDDYDYQSNSAHIYRVPIHCEKSAGFIEKPKQSSSVSLEREVLLALEALKRDGLKAFSVLVARVIEDGAPPPPKMTKETFEKHLETLLKKMANDGDSDTSGVCQTPEASHLTPEMSNTPKIKRRGSVGTAIVQRVRRLSITAQTALGSVGISGSTPRMVHSESRGKLINALSGTSSKGSQIVGSEKSASAALLGNLPPVTKDESEAAVNELISDHMLAMLLGALCTDIYEFLESEPIVQADTITPEASFSLSTSDLPTIEVHPPRRSGVTTSQSQAGMAEAIREVESGSGSLQDSNQFNSYAAKSDQVEVEHVPLKGGEESLPNISKPALAPHHEDDELMSVHSANALRSSVASVISTSSDVSDLPDTAPIPGGRRVSRVAQDVEKIMEILDPEEYEELSEVRREMWQEIEELLRIVRLICKLRIEEINSATAADFAARMSAATSSNRESPLRQQIEQSSNALSTGTEDDFDLAAFLSSNPQSNSARPSDTKTKELGEVISAIDRVVKSRPRFSKQDVTLSDTKLKDISTAKLIDMIERLNRGAERMSAQRSSPPQKYEALNYLVDKITESAKRRMDNQCFVMSLEHSRNMEIGKISGLVENAQKRRIRNQEYVTKEERMLQDLQKLQEVLSTTTTEMAKQSYTMSEKKEKEMFMGKLTDKISRSNSKRMSGQDAYKKKDLKEHKFSEVDQILDKMFSSEPLNSQRASVTNPRLSAVIASKMQVLAPVNQG